MISFIVPAHNEEQHLGATLRAIEAAARGADAKYEVIVVDDSSTDRTAEIAQAHGARVVNVAHRQISATRNSGARIAAGEMLFFVDADTLINAAVVRDALQAIEQGAVGGGCVIRFDGPLPLWARIIHPAMVLAARAIKFVGGCCLFCTREAFAAIGGFSEEYYAAEEVGFIRGLKREGRFVILGPALITSGRKLRLHSARELFGVLGNALLRGPKHYRHREGLDLWYGARRPDIADAREATE